MEYWNETHTMYVFVFSVLVESVRTVVLGDSCSCQ